jgi:hypothetical protein
MASRLWVKDLARGSAAWPAIVPVRAGSFGTEVPPDDANAGELVKLLHYPSFRVIDYDGRFRIH